MLEWPGEGRAESLLRGTTLEVCDAMCQVDQSLLYGMMTDREIHRPRDLVSIEVRKQKWYLPSFTLIYWGTWYFLSLPLWAL